MTTAELTVTRNEDAHRFEIHIDNLVAELDYALHGDVITFIHTGVPSELEGQGLGSRLARTGLDYARANGLKVISQCWFINGYLEKNMEYQDLLK